MKRTVPAAVTPIRRDRPTLVDTVCSAYPYAPLPVLSALQSADAALARIARAVGAPPEASPEDIAAAVDKTLEALRG